MLIKFKVKTLDAQTHEFSIDNEITIAEFKEKIAERTGITPEQQRIIFCGRVLPDEKYLKDFDVDGKVVHVAERPPPTPRNNTTSTTSTTPSAGGDGNGTRGMRNSPLFRALDGMVLGTMSIPVNSGVSTNVQVPINPFASSSSFCMNRITVARHMLDCANNVAAYLEDPSRGLNNTPLDILASGRWTMESTVVEVGITAADMPQSTNLVEMVHGAVSAALRRNANTNVTVVQLPTVYGSNDGPDESESGDANISNRNNATVNDNESVNDGNTATVIIEDVTVTRQDGQNASSSNAEQIVDPSSQLSNALAAATVHLVGSDIRNMSAPNANAPSTNTNSSDNQQAPPRRRTGTRVLAETIEQMRNVQARLNPFIQQYYDLLYNEPTFSENDTVSRDNAQRLFDRVSEGLHYMSHAQHAISDLMLDVSQPAPRYLTCRPILVEQSGYVSTNNYLTAAAAAASAQPQQQQPQQLQSQSQSEPQQSQSQSESRQPQQIPLPFMHNRVPASNGYISLTSGIPSSPDPLNILDYSDSLDDSSDPDDAITEDPVITTTLPIPMLQNVNPSVENNDNHVNMARLIQAVVDSAPADTEFHVQINAPNFLAFGAPTNGGTNNTNATTTSSSTTANSTEANVNESNNTSPTNNSPQAATPLVNAGNQARVNTATLPTTSTQTRSTPRPQLQIGNVPTTSGRIIPSNLMSSFDRFLPCNSHHIRENENSNHTNNPPTAAVAPISQAHNIPTINPRLIHGMTHNIRPLSNPSVNNNDMQRAAAPGNRGRRSNALRNLLSTFANRSVTNEGTNSSPEVTSAVSQRNLRSQFLNFVSLTVFEGLPINQETIPNAINRALQWFGETLIYLPQYEKPEYNSRDSVFNILRRTLQMLIELHRNSHFENLTQFDWRLRHIFDLFMTRLYSVLTICIGRTNAEMYWAQLMRLLLIQIRAYFRDEALHFLRIYINPTSPPIPNTDDVQQFIVHRNIPQADNERSEIFLSLSSLYDVHPMETDATESDTAADILAATGEIELIAEPPTNEESSTSGTDKESLPIVEVGSEEWHRNFSIDWLPIITNDIETQNEDTTPQPVLSDAYLSGMSAKRRKMLQSEKPSTDVKSLIAGSVKIAMESSNVSSSTTANETQSAEEITAAIVNDATVQASYTDAIRMHVRERIVNNPDYTDDKYPQISKFVKNK